MVAFIATLGPATVRTRGARLEQPVPPRLTDAAIIVVLGSSAATG